MYLVAVSQVTSCWSPNHHEGQGKIVGIYLAIYNEYNE